MENELRITPKSISESGKLNFRLWLQRQFTDRCKRNGRYSLRAFAKALNIDPSSLSQILSGKRPLTKKSMETICKRLGASPKELRDFALLKVDSSEDHYHQIQMDTFSVISDWYHYAILELTFVSGFKADPKWIGKKLSITTEEARSAIERLKRLGLLLEENGSTIKSSKFLTNLSNVDSSAAHRELQKQIIEKALLSIDDCPQEEKDITSMTMAIDVSNLETARGLIRKFRRDLCALLEDGDQTRVYNLGIQLYPISKQQENL
jgi:transcriptional regulator with XRE-family HTH domain